MVYALTYKPVQHLPNPMESLNPLKKGTGRTVSLQDRVDTLNKSSVWKKTVREWRSLDKQVDNLRLPKVSMEKLGLLWVAEDIQRPILVKHCAITIGSASNFDPALLQTIQCIKTSEGKFISIDSQHTAATIAALIDAGFLTGVSDWREFEFPFQYIETDQLSYARRAFGKLNGKGKKPQSQYQQLRNSVFIVRIDNDRSDPKDEEIERKVLIAENHHCYPVEKDSLLNQHPGTFSNISTFTHLNENEIEIACKWHNTYFHYASVHVSLFFIFRDLVREFAPAKIKITEKLLEDLAALVQDRFANLQQFQESVTEAHRRWSEQRHGYVANWNDDAYACSLLQLYIKLGGQEKVAPTLLDRFDDLIEFFDNEITTI